MKLEAVNSRMNPTIEGFHSKDVSQAVLLILWVLLLCVALVGENILPIE